MSDAKTKTEVTETQIGELWINKRMILSKHVQEQADRRELDWKSVNECMGKSMFRIGQRQPATDDKSLDGWKYKLELETDPVITLMVGLITDYKDNKLSLMVISAWMNDGEIPDAPIGEMLRNVPVLAPKNNGSPMADSTKRMLVSLEAVEEDWTKTGAISDATMGMVFVTLARVRGGTR